VTDSPTPSTPDALPIGTVLGDFKITNTIGFGGFGMVYLAYESLLERTVAIKEYLPVSIAGRASDQTVRVRSLDQLETYESGLKAFVREARLQARFSHPAMLEVYRVWEQNGTAYMAMRYYPGTTLRDLRKAPTTTQGLTEQLIRAYLEPVCDAVRELHAQNVVHRDIAPDNILIMANESPVLLDFGAARAVVAGGSQQLTTVLKPGYAPIEQYADDGTIAQGPWTDVYALGAVMYFLVTGSPPPQPVSRLLNDALGEFDLATRDRYSTAFINGVRGALAVKPEQRWQTVEALCEALGWDALPRTFIKTSVRVEEKREPSPEQPRTVASPSTQAQTVLIETGDKKKKVEPVRDTIAQSRAQSTKKPATKNTRKTAPSPSAPKIADVAPAPVSVPAPPLAVERASSPSVLEAVRAAAPDDVPTPPSRSKREREVIRDTNVQTRDARANKRAIVAVLIVVPVFALVSAFVYRGAGVSRSSTASQQPVVSPKLPEAPTKTENPTSTPQTPSTSSSPSNPGEPLAKPAERTDGTETRVAPISQPEAMPTASEKAASKPVEKKEPARTKTDGVETTTTVATKAAAPKTKPTLAAPANPPNPGVSQPQNTANCEKLYAKLSLGTADLTSEERARLAACR
jgi:non-specific serine/threonine protein kinase